MGGDGKIATLKIPKLLGHSDLVVGCVGANPGLITAEHIHHAFADRPAYKPLLMIDLAVPRNIVSANMIIQEPIFLS